MRKLHVEKLTHEAFAPFGTFYDFAAPDGYALEGELHRFYPDRMREAYSEHVGFSPICVKRPKKMIVRAVEYHTRTSEIIFPLNDDMILHVAPASNGVPVPHLAHAFRVPKHTMVLIRPGVWHLCPLPVDADVLSAMIVLPECTYANDCVVVDLSDEQAFEIERP